MATVPIQEIKCPACWCKQSQVINIRAFGGRVRKQRECRHCGKTYWTTDATATTPPIVPPLPIYE